MTIVLTAETFEAQDLWSYNALFAAGLHTLHVRFPNRERAYYEEFVLGIDPKYRSRLVVCDHYDLVQETGVGGVHLSSSRRGSYDPEQWRGVRVSTSAHSIRELQALPFRPTYALLSPAFDSISKGGYRGTLDFEACRRALPTLPFPVLALGGITPERVPECLAAGFAGVAILGDLALRSASERLARWGQYPEPPVLAVGGHDPSSGAGVVQDALQIRACDASPLTVCSALTVQTDMRFTRSTPVEEEQYRSALAEVLRDYPRPFTKVGMLQSIDQMRVLTDHRERLGPIIWDPVLAPSRGGGETFVAGLDKTSLAAALQAVTVVTPNREELQRLLRIAELPSAKALALQYDVVIVEKSAEKEEDGGICTDIVHYPDGSTTRLPIARSPYEKHGTGCVYSSVLASRLAQGYATEQACHMAQLAVDRYRRSSDSLRGGSPRVAVGAKEAALKKLALMFVTHAKSANEVIAQVEGVLQGGCKCIQLRMKEATSEERLAVARVLRPRCTEHGALLIINDDVEVALRSDADGVHLGLHDTHPTKARQLIGPDKLIGGTCNTTADVRRRLLEGVDYIGAGPFRDTHTKERLSPLLGADGLESLCQATKSRPFAVPILAIGGIEPEDVSTLLACGAAGVAVSGYLCRATDRTTATGKLLHCINPHTHTT